MRTIAQIYDAYNHGRTLPTNELVRGRDHMNQLAKFARQAGPEFRLTANEASNVALAFQSFIDERNRK